MKTGFWLPREKSSEFVQLPSQKEWGSYHSPHKLPHAVRRDVCGSGVDEDALRGHVSHFFLGSRPSASFTATLTLFLQLLLMLSVTHTLLEVILPLVAEAVKNLPAMQETWVQSLCQEDPLEKGMATHSSILAWRITWTEEPGRIQSMGSQRQTRLSA